MQQKGILCLFLCLALLGITGCGKGGPKTAEVSGTITLDGQPIPGAVVSFIPEHPEGSPSYGGTDPEGKYSLMFTRETQGAMLGKHRVEIETRKLRRSEVSEMKAEGQEVPTAYVAIPKKYRQPGALTAEVDRGGNQIDFALTSR